MNTVAESDGGVQRHARLRALFEQARELETEALEAFLGQLRGADARLAEELRELVAAQAAAGDTLSNNALEILGIVSDVTNEEPESLVRSVRSILDRED